MQSLKVAPQVQSWGMGPWLADLGSAGGSSRPARVSPSFISMHACGYIHEVQAVESTSHH